jgi:hypothetical protein
VQLDLEVARILWSLVGAVAGSWSLYFAGHWSRVDGNNLAATRGSLVVLTILVWITWKSFEKATLP